MRLFQRKVVEINTLFIFTKHFSRKSCCLRDNVDKYVGVRQDTDGNIIRRINIACWVPKARETRSEYVILLFHGKSGYSKAP